MREDWHHLLEKMRAAGDGVVTALRGAAQVFPSVVVGTDRLSAVLEWNVLADSASTAKWLGSLADRLSHSETALALAAAAYLRAVHLREERCVRPIGVGCATSISASSSAYSAEGHRCFVATHTETTTQLHTLMHPHPAEPALDGPAALDDVLRLSIARACGVELADDRTRLAMTAVSFEQQRAEPLMADVWAGRARLIWSMPDGRLQPAENRSPAGLLSGSFNPFHAGHAALREAAQRWLGRPVDFELSVLNADKPALDFLTIARRCRQFRDQPLALTNAATFVGKAECCPGAAFVVGVDTVRRIIEPRFYADGDDGMRSALKRMRELGCRFLVAGRMLELRFLTLNDVAIPDEFSEMFDELPVDEFRMDVSSTLERRTRGT